LLAISRERFPPRDSEQFPGAFKGQGKTWPQKTRESPGELESGIENERGRITVETRGIREGSAHGGIDEEG
jgi:hypothetical protein